LELLGASEAGKYAKIAGKRPDWLLHRHPDGRHVALQAIDAGLNRAGVWDDQSGGAFRPKRLVWESPEAIALAWTPGGDEIFVVTSRYERSADHPPMIVSPLQSETTYRLERRSWPHRELLGSCPIHLPTGWVDWVGVSPVGDRVAVRWIEQDCAGFVLADPGAPKQLEEAVYRTEPNLISVPVFAPDGRNIVTSCGRSSWWNASDPTGALFFPGNADDEASAGAGDLDTPSRGGTYEVGHVAVYTVDHGPVRQEPISVTIPSGWLPPDPESGEAEMLGEPHFISRSAFSVALPNGEVRTFELADIGREP
jgi:hypothetical protein